MSSTLSGVSSRRFDCLVESGYVRDVETGVWTLRAAHGSTFAYTDGDEVEQRLLDVVLRTSDRSVLSLELRLGITDWPSRYHLSPVRANLLRPFATLLQGKSVLEIGAGCGALTRFLGESGALTIALEGSPQRARIGAARCNELESVAVVADTLQSFSITERFDVVTLVGVLEYARIHYRVDEVDPVGSMLDRARSLLKPGGVLIVAIENQLGLKYFAGACEDHVATPMYGVEDLYECDGVVTFGRRELDERLLDAGFTVRDWWYPFPDYKLPVSILSDRAVSNPKLADLSALIAASVVADPQVPPAFGFSLEQAWLPIYRNGLAGHFANSFLVLASDETAGADPLQLQSLAFHYSAERRPCFAKALRFVENEEGVHVFAQGLADPVTVADMPLTHRLESQRLIDGELMQTRLIRILNRPGWAAVDIAKWAERWLGCLFADRTTPQHLSSVLPGRWLDAVPRNLIVSEGQGVFFDLEWEWNEPIEFGYLLYRGIVLSLLGMSSCAKPADTQRVDMLSLFVDVLQSIGYLVTATDFARFHRMEQEFQTCVHGGVWIGCDELATHNLTVRGSSVQ